MLDFTSALYLGLRHPSCALRPWRSFSTGAPAALTETPLARQVARELAGLLACEAALVAPSTLHLAWDLFGVLAAKPITLLMDAGVYAITRWGVQRAAMRRANVRIFPHHDAAALERTAEAVPPGHTSVVVTDGFCPTCGRVAPLGDYLAAARRRRGLLVVDDTQALGVLGRSPSARMPYGCDGGGTPAWCGVRGPELLVFASLAKGLGVPVAVLAGSMAYVRAFEQKSLTRVHCSPPSNAVLRAAEHAMHCNRRYGAARRDRLATLVRRFRRGVGAPSAELGGGLFPVQRLRPPPGMTAAALHRRLLETGVRTVLQRDERGHPSVTFLLNARHTGPEIDFAATAAHDAIAVPSHPITPTRKESHHEESVYHRV